MLGSARTRAWNSISFAGLEIPLEKNFVYTVEIQESSGDFGWSVDGQNSYAGGKSGNGSSSDYLFRVYMDTCNTNQLIAPNNTNWDLSHVETLSFTNGSYINSSEFHFLGDITANAFNTHSDARIKDIQGISNAKEDLSKLLEIEIIDYQLIDSLQGKNKPIKKVIAQQVAEVYPQAVQTDLVKVIPNIYRFAEAKSGWIPIQADVQVGDRIKIIYQDQPHMLSVTELSAGSFRVNVKVNGEIFIYGKEVNDFHTVDYQALTTLNISATQALAKQVNSLQAENQLLRAQLLLFQQQIDEIQQLHSMKNK